MKILTLSLFVAFLQLFRKMPNYLEAIQKQVPLTMELDKDVIKKEEIAKGDRATVYNGIRLKDGLNVTIKVLYNEIPDKNSIKRYITEIQAINLCNSPYTVKLVGYSVKGPLMIITESVEKDSLFTLLQQNKFDSTQKNILLLEIAYALKHIHSQKFIHGNVSPHNIIFDSNQRTKICGFGNCRYPLKPTQYKEDTIKSLNWSSPEFVSGNDFTEKHDIFSFGSLLYHIVTGKMPFDSMSQSEIIENLKSYKLPKLPSDIPPKIAKLISDCWDKPDKRPSMEEILNLLFKKDYLLQDVNSGRVESAIQRLHGDDEDMVKQMFKDLARTDPKDFKDALKKAYPTIKASKENIAFFFAEIKSLFVKKTSTEQFSYLLDASLSLMKKRDACDAFVKHHLHLRLPFDKEELIDQGLDIVFTIVLKSPNAINADFVPFIKYLMRYRPEKVVIIVSEYAKNLNEVDDPLPILDAVMTSWKRIKDNKSVAAPFLSLFSYLCRVFPDYKAKRGELCSTLFRKFLDSRSKVAICVALTGLYYIEGESFNLDLEPVLALLKDPQTSKTMLSLMLMLDSIQINDNRIVSELVDTLLQRAQRSNRAALLLCKVACERNAADCLMQDDSWLCAELPTLDSTFRIMLVAMRHESVRKKLRNSDNMKYLLYMACDKSSNIPLRCVIDVIKGFGVDTEDEVKEWDDTGLFRRILNCAYEQCDDRSFCHTLSFFSKIATVKEIPILVDLVDASLITYSKVPNIADHLIPLFYNLSKLPKCALRLEETRALDAIAQEFKKTEYVKFGTVIRKNIRAAHLPKSTY